MSSNWVLDTHNLEIRLRDCPWYVRLWHWLTLKRYSVKELYIYVYDYFHHPSRIEALMPIEYPIDHDNIKKPKSVPTNYVMRGEWEIPEEHAKKLIKGPLISKDGSTLIVPADSYLNIMARWFGRFIGWLMIPGGLYATWEAIKALL